MNQSTHFIEFQNSNSSHQNNHPHFYQKFKSVNQRICHHLLAILLFIICLAFAFIIMSNGFRNQQLFNYLSKTKWDIQIIPNLLANHMTNFYIDLYKNVYLLIITLLLACILSLFTLNLILTYLSEMISLLRALLHISLLSITLIFLERSGQIPLFQNLIFLEYDTHLFSYHNFYYSIAFFCLQVIWILVHCCLFSQLEEGKAIISITFELIQKIKNKYYFNGLMSGFIGLFIYNAILFSGFILSFLTNYHNVYQFNFTFMNWNWNRNNDNLRNFQKYMLTFTLQHQFIEIYHIFYLIVSIWLIYFLIQLTVNINKCMYYEQITSVYSFKKCLLKIISLIGFMIFNSFIFPLKIIDRFVILCIKMVEDYYKENQIQSCCPINFRKYLRLMFNDNAFLQLYITKQQSYEQNQRQSLLLCLKNEKVYKMINRAKWLIFFITTAFSFTIGFLFIAFVNLNRSYKSQFIRLQYQLILIIILCFAICGISMSYLTAAVDAIFYTYVNIYQSGKKHTITSPYKTWLQQKIDFLHKYEAGAMIQVDDRIQNEVA